jgi:hypothetical protein
MGTVMPTFDLPHRCSQEKTKQCIEAWLRALQQEQARWIESASITWQDTTAKFELGLRTPLGRIPASGTLRVEASMFCLQYDELPLRAAFFRGRVRSVICDALTAKCKDCSAC